MKLRIVIDKLYTAMLSTPEPIKHFRRIFIAKTVNNFQAARFLILHNFCRFAWQQSFDAMRTLPSITEL